MSDEDDEDPLEDLYEDGSSFDRERLTDALDGIIGIDPGDGHPVYKKGYQELSKKGQFVSQLLYRKAALLLGEISESEIGITSSEAAANQDVAARTIRNYGKDLDFVDRDEDLGGYYLRDYGINRAIDFVRSNRDQS